jgi:hypothetical protein
MDESSLRLLLILAVVVLQEVVQTSQKVNEI